MIPLIHQGEVSAVGLSEGVAIVMRAQLGTPLMKFMPAKAMFDMMFTKNALLFYIFES